MHAHTQTHTDTRTQRHTLTHTDTRTHTHTLTHTHTRESWGDDSQNPQQLHVDDIRMVLGENSRLLQVRASYGLLSANIGNLYLSSLKAVALLSIPIGSFIIDAHIA